jgi:hypothetical protein
MVEAELLPSSPSVASVAHAALFSRVKSSLVSKFFGVETELRILLEIITGISENILPLIIAHAASTITCNDAVIYR